MSTKTLSSREIQLYGQTESHGHLALQKRSLGHFCECWKIPTVWACQVMPHISGSLKKVNNTWTECKGTVKESCVQSQSPHLRNDDDSPDATPTGVLKSRSGTCLHQARTQLSSVNSRSESESKKDLSPSLKDDNLLLCPKSHLIKINSYHDITKHSAHLGSSWGESLITTWGRPPSLVRPIRFVKAKLSKQHGEIVKSKSIHTCTWAPRADGGSYSKMFQCENGKT